MAADVNDRSTRSPTFCNQFLVFSHSQRYINIPVLTFPRAVKISLNNLAGDAGIVEMDPFQPIPPAKKLPGFVSSIYNFEDGCYGPLPLPAPVAEIFNGVLPCVAVHGSLEVNNRDSKELKDASM